MGGDAVLWRAGANRVQRFFRFFHTPAGALEGGFGFLDGRVVHLVRGFCFFSRSLFFFSCGRLLLSCARGCFLRLDAVGKVRLLATP